MANASKTENERLERHLNGFLNYVTISSFQSNSEVKFLQFIQFHKNDGFSFPHTIITVLHSKHKESVTVQAKNLTSMAHSKQCSTANFRCWRKKRVAKKLNKLCISLTQIFLFEH